MKYVNGDLLALAKQGEFDVIAHGCNCQCVMGAGFAKQVKEQFPEAYEADRETIVGDRSKLGTNSVAFVNNFVIVNCYTQWHWIGYGVKVDYDAVRDCMKRINSAFPNKRIGLPLIGCGKAGGDWNIVSRIIKEELINCNVTIVEYEG